MGKDIINIGSEVMWLLELILDIWTKKNNELLNFKK